MTSVFSLSTTVTDWGRWPVRCSSKALAARAICCATLDPEWLMGGVLGERGGFASSDTKKADVAEYPEVFDHVGLLIVGSPGSHRITLHLVFQRSLPQL